MVQGESAVALELTRRRFTVDEYHRMAEAGILGEDDRVELVDGEIVEMTPIGSRHAAGVYRLGDCLYRAYGDLALVGVQNPVRLSGDSEPQPDLTLLHRKPDFYASGHPTPEDVYLLVEVAESSAEVDRRVKVPLYARSGIAEVWLADLDKEAVTVYRDPSDQGYRVVRTLRRGDSIAPAEFPERAVPVSEVLG